MSARDHFRGHGCTRRQLLALAALPGFTSLAASARASTVGPSAPALATAGRGQASDDQTGRSIDAIEPAEHEGGSVIQGGPDIGATNPILSPFSELGELVFEDLVDMRSDTWELFPVLAESWAVSDDGLVWTFTIRDGVTWHDGMPLTAKDVAFSFTGGHMHPEIGPEASFFNERIAAVEVIGEREVAFSLHSPTVHFPNDYIQFYPILPEHIWGAIPPAEWTSHPATIGADPSLVIGTGPFRFQEYVPGDHVTLARNEAYWRGAPHLDEFIVKFTADDGATMSGLLAGEIDVVHFVDPATIEALPQDDFHIYSSTGRYVSTIRLNLDPERTTLFIDERVRQAMLLAIDRQAIVDAVDFGYGVAPVTWMMPGYWALDPSGVTSSYGFDPTAAGRLLDETGWTLGADGVREKDGQRFAFLLYVYSGSQGDVARAQLVQENWAAVGIAAEIITEETAIYDERWADIDFEAMLSVTYIGPTVEHGYWWECDAVYSTGYCNQRVDELFERGRNIADRAERIALYTEIQDILMRELPALPLALRDNISVVNKRVHNIRDDFSYFYAETWWVDP